LPLRSKLRRINPQRLMRRPKTKLQLSLPHRSNRILINQVIGSQYYKLVHNSLTNQHPVKGIFVENRKPAQMQSGFFVKWKRINAMLLSLCRDKSHGRFRKRQLTPRVFDGDLPRRDRAQVNVILRIYEQLSRVIR
jgi:hypothetical protein